MIYLDNAATTFPKPNEVYQALDYANRNLAFNAGRGSYTASKDVFKMIDETRIKLARLVPGAYKDDVVFTSSATEALNLIINGLDFTKGDTVYISPFEHNAIVRPLLHLAKTEGINVKILPFDKKTWYPDIDRIKDIFLLEKPKAIFLSHISNTTGYILPYETIFSEGHKYDSINVLDCAQSLGVLKVTGISEDFLVFAGHKSLYASFGVAGFISLCGSILKITKSGGTGSDSLNPEMPNTMPGKYEAGSPNSVAIAGLSASLDWLEKENVFEHESFLTRYLIEKMRNLPKVILYIPSDSNILGILSFNIEDYSPEDVCLILANEYNIAVRVGYHCAPLVHQFIGSLEFLGTVRASIGAFTTQKEIDFFVTALSTF